MRGIVTLCGSTRFKEQFEEVNRRLTWSGWVVLSVGSFHHSEKDHSVADQIIKRKVKLDVLHKEKIDLSWAIVVINVGKEQGVTLGYSFTVYRDGEYVGEIKVEQLQNDLAGASPVPGTIRSEIRKGDNVTTRIR